MQKLYQKKNNGSDADAADNFQESISIAWLNLRSGKFQGDAGQFNAYIRQICRYKWINQLRSTASNRLVLQEDLSTFSELIESNSIEEDSNNSMRLQASFAGIGEKCRDLLSRFYFNKESLASIAQVMDTTEASMKTIKYRCMMRLRKAYLERLEDDE